MTSALQSAFAFRGSLSRRKRIAVALGSSFLVLIVWQIASWCDLLDPTFLPAPLDILGTLCDMTARGEIIGNALISIARIMAAFVLSAAMAIPIGMLMSSFQPVSAALEPIIDFIRYLPTPALIPISIIWFGVGEETKIFLLWLGTFFQLVLLVVDDANRVPHEYVEVARTIGARPYEILRDIIWRSMLPGLVNNLRITLGWCWTYLILAEIVAADNGLGYVIWTARRYMKTNEVMAGVFVIGIIGLVTDQAMRALHAWLFRNQQAGR